MDLQGESRFDGDMKRILFLLFLLAFTGCSRTHQVTFIVEGTNLQTATITKIITVGGVEQKSSQFVMLPWIDKFSATSGTSVGVNAIGEGSDLSAISVTLLVDNIAVKQGKDINKMPSATAAGKL